MLIDLTLNIKSGIIFKIRRVDCHRILYILKKNKFAFYGGLLYSFMEIE